jgi:hypothetical protein
VGRCDPFPSSLSKRKQTYQIQLFRLTEQPLSNSLGQLYQRNLYTLAISLAQSRGLASSEIAEIYRRYGDHLYGKADYEGAMGCYLKTVGVVQASYVIRKVRLSFFSVPPHIC